MIKFGPAGNSDAFYEQGYKHTYEAMAWLESLGLSAFEYSFGRGAKLKQETGEKIHEEAKKHGISVSVHAPYFINLAGDDEEKFEKNIQYFMDTTLCAGFLQADRMIFHPGTCAKMDRGIAFENTKRNLARMMKIMDENGRGNHIFCPETMGKVNQIGSLEEIAELCLIDERLYPTIDFGHLNAREQGILKTKADFEAVVDHLTNTIGKEKTDNMHVHFSHIEYTKMGEKMHLTFEDSVFGPFFDPLAEIFAERNMSPTVICESKGTQAIDALAMKKMYEAAR